MEQAATEEGAETPVWRDGALVSARDGALSPHDASVLTGAGIFETLAARDGDPFAPGRHYRRLAEAAARIGTSAPPEAEFREALAAVLGASGMGDARLRATLTATGGFLVTAEPLPEYPATARVRLAPFTRNPDSALAGIKSTSYGENALALKWARGAGADEAIFANTAGMLCEGSATNLFLSLGGRLVTPPLSSGCLPGITRGLVLELCQRHHIDAAEADIEAGEFGEAEEGFLTSSLRDIQPVERFDGRDFYPCPGALTAQVMELFAEAKRNDLDPA